MNEIVNTEHREKMEALEKSMLESGKTIDLDVKHYFSNGCYTRELFIPKGTLLTGKIHLHSCINIISKGKILAITDTDKTEISAPHTFVSGPGVKKAGYALEDTIWINVFPWDGKEKDPEAMIKMLTVETYKELDAIENKTQETIQ